MSRKIHLWPDSRMQDRKTSGHKETEDRVGRSKLSAIEFPEGTKEDREELILKKQQGNFQN